MGFNRTFMELKSSKAAAMRSNVGFNRTFMELKYEGETILDNCMGVLIVPLWN